VIIVLLFVIGLSIGSFINALVYRLQNKKKIGWDRSECPHCHHQLNWHDLIPLLSLLILKGRCRYCRKPISWQYPLVEFLTGVVFVLRIFQPGADQPLASNIQYLIYLVFAVILMIIFAYDLRYMLIPDKISIPAIVLLLIVQLLIGNYQLPITSYLLAAAVASGFFFLQFIISKGKWIGGGDIRLGFLIGLMLGWPNILLGLFLAYILGTIISLPLVILGKQSLKSQVPFGVFLSLSTIFSLLWGNSVIEWYLGLLK